MKTEHGEMTFSFLSLDSPCIKQTLCNVLKKKQCGKYLVAYALNFKNLFVSFVVSNTSSSGCLKCKNRKNKVFNAFIGDRERERERLKLSA